MTVDILIFPAYRSQELAVASLISSKTFWPGLLERRVWNRIYCVKCIYWIKNQVKK
jgi:hypothetical protein